MVVEHLEFETSLLSTYLLHIYNYCLGLSTVPWSVIDQMTLGSLFFHDSFYSALVVQVLCMLTFVIGRTVPDCVSYCLALLTECDVCGEVCSEPCNLRRHLLIHRRFESKGKRNCYRPRLSIPSRFS